jgi:hypothetical protein
MESLSSSSESESFELRASLLWASLSTDVNHLLNQDGCGRRFVTREVTFLTNDCKKMYKTICDFILIL